MTHRIVVLGAGYAGLAAAKQAARRLADRRKSPDTQRPSGHFGAVSSTWRRGYWPSR
jgi:thioredoxin reductase